MSMGRNSMKKLLIIIVVIGLSSLAVAAEKAATPGRIVSLAPNTTEILFALGLGDHIVGVTTFCDHPEEAKKKPKIGGMSNPSLEAVVSLKPDLVVVSEDGNPKEFWERLLALNIKTYVFRARRLRELPQGIRELGAAVGAKEKADTLAKEIEDRIIKLTKDSNSSVTKKILFIVWPEPLIVAGPRTAMDDAIALLGCTNIAHNATTAYPKYSIETVLRQAPDVLIIGKATGMDMRAVSQGFLKRLSLVPAVRNDKICYVSDNLYRLAPRVVRGIEELAECLK